ncbi:unnamed protein product, partial [Rotaria magnacalcarata]
MTGRNYGLLKDFDHHLVHSGHAYGTPRALLILEAQQKLFAFLRRILSAVLNLDPQTSLTMRPEPAHDKLGLDHKNWRRCIEVGVGSMAYDFGLFSSSGPFKPSPKFDIDVFLTMVRNYESNALDE